MTPLQGLPPLIGAQARVLILGSFPSTASLDAGQYYAFRHNQFWRILGRIIGQPLAAMDYPARKQAILASGIAIWDVFASCQRAGSLDSAIREGRPNDFGVMKRLAPNLLKVCFNGQSAGRHSPALQALGYATVILPSTSPANASWSFERKLVAWRAGLRLDAK